MLVLGLDFETTGLDPQSDQIIEIGAVVWDTKSNKPVKMLSELIQYSGQIPEAITEITGITQGELDDWGIPLIDGLNQLQGMASRCSYIVAHNGNSFDKPFLEKAVKDSAGPEFTTPWIDTIEDVPYHSNIGTRKLTYLAAEHGFLNPFSHRALFDVLTMMQVFCKYDLETIIELQSSPTVKLVAQVSYDQRDLAKKSGFRWDPVARHWYKGMKEKMVADQNFPFEVQLV